ncbi:hypothetical protein GCM10027594_08310 [Hymenobacter agri]
MQKFILSLALAATATGAAQAQTPASTVGISLAYGRSRLLDNNNYKSTGHSAYQAGLNADVYLTEAVSFHPELLYTMRYYDTNSDATASLNRDVTSLDVPLLLRYYAGGLYFEGGPEVDVPIKAVNEEAENVKSQVNSVALNYVVGLGYQFGHGPSLGVRYDGGASNVFKSDATTVLGSGKYKTSNLCVVLAYSFGSRK